MTSGTGYINVVQGQDVTRDLVNSEQTALKVAMETEEMCRNWLWFYRTDTTDRAAPKRPTLPGDLETFVKKPDAVGQNFFLFRSFQHTVSDIILRFQACIGWVFWWAQTGVAGVQVEHFPYLLYIGAYW